MTKNDKRRFGLISREERKGCSSSTVLFFVLYCCICCVLLGPTEQVKLLIGSIGFGLPLLLLKVLMMWTCNDV